MKTLMIFLSLTLFFSNSFATSYDLTLKDKREKEAKAIGFDKVEYNRYLDQFLLSIKYFKFKPKSKEYSKKLIPGRGFFTLSSIVDNKYLIYYFTDGITFAVVTNGNNLDKYHAGMYLNADGNNYFYQYLGMDKFKTNNGFIKRLPVFRQYHLE